jgi:hypothetical protein
MPKLYVRLSRQSAQFNGRTSNRPKKDPAVSKLLICQEKFLASTFVIGMIAPPIGNLAICRQLSARGASLNLGGDSL